MMATTLLRLKTAAILLALLASCGGGGGGEAAPASHAPLSGTYLHLSMGDLAAVPAAGSIWGSLVANGSGGGIIQINNNDNGEVTLDLVGSPLTTVVEPSGAWHILGPDGQPNWSGGLSPDSSVGTMATARAGGPPVAGLVIRPAGAYSMAAFAGEYHGTHWSYDPSSEAAAAGRTDAIFGVMGVWIARGDEHRGGSLVPYSGTGNHTVTGTGVLSVQDGPNNFVGAITPGGELGAVSGGTHDGNTLALRLYVRTSSGASNLAFAGTYAVVALGRAGLFSIGLWGTLTADGAGRWTSTTVGKVDTMVAPESSSAGTYGVAPDGRITLFLENGTRLEGGVSGSGAYATLAGSTNDTGGPQIWILVRQ